MALGSSFFGQGTGPIFADGLDCRGNETSLQQCSRTHSGLRICIHSQDAGLVCPAPATDDCDVYSSLVYRTERYCFALMNCPVSWERAKRRCGIFGALLAKMDEHIMTDATANAIANAFKIRKDVPVHVYVGFDKRHGNAPGWLLDGTNVTTPDVDWGTEGDGVLSIDHRGDSVNYTWILSPGISELPYICQFDLYPLKARLVDRPNPRAGRVEVYYFNAWMTVCENRFGYQEAQVVCRMLGFPTDRVIALPGAFFGEGTGLIFLDNLRCRGDETSLRQCSRESNEDWSCKHSDDVGVVCPAPVTDDCDMYSSLVYRTERYCFGLMTKPVSWDIAEWRCRTFGGVLAKMDEHILTDSTVSAIADTFKIRKDVHVHVGFHKRSGNAVWLLDGSNVTFPGVDWGPDGDGMMFIGHREDSVQYMLLVHPNYDLRPFICQFDPQPLKVRLVNGPNPRAGRLEVYYFDAWGTVCDEKWDSLDAEVVCRMLGFPSDRAVAHKNAFFGKGTGPIHLNDVGCRGSEANLRHCPHRGPHRIGKINETCGHYMDASVVCPDPSDGTMPEILGGTTTAESVGETTDVTVYGTTAVSIYVISDTPLISTTTSSADEHNVDKTGDDSRAGTTRRTKLTRRTRTRRQKKPAPIRKVVAMTMESVYMNGQALIENRSAMVTMCSRLCSSDDRCARFNYNQVTGACRIFSKDAEVSYKTKPDWTVWEAIVIPQ